MGAAVALGKREVVLILFLEEVRAIRCGRAEPFECEKKIHRARKKIPGSRPRDWRKGGKPLNQPQSFFSLYARDESASAEERASFGA
jgi:hypothetical protein